ncbi:Peptidyl-prolyl cis-trans isomerase FKBP13, chloroplastic [Tetrabaena socialis]|uniref:peptidylprolyl isomerase n=1 Tax=Tetrabaena socialis TaxID=47790 RepID=A0A2J7ZY28_9CHLO|nr:Peptidyl-prolyl cis-trans isomerase FKBP13, chloroplastic [Tetrabaena socialis]|eukprot:PNH05162.1 Peptidyl-prolyl cis-trans isomerase FKBP13, chloroplastic [Tetrabaena socialis]
MALALQSARIGAACCQGRIRAAAPARHFATRVNASGKHATQAGAGDATADLTRRAALAAAAATYIAAAAAFPAVAADDGLTASASGLQWKDVEVGTGPAPVKGSTIKCHYTGRLTNGTVFDSSLPRRQPLQFQIGVGQVIKGWDMGILGADDIPAMKEGGKRLLVIPPGLAYGARGAGGVIPPNATLEFDVELLPRK